jgi:hypothetical protein
MPWFKAPTLLLPDLIAQNGRRLVDRLAPEGCTSAT